MLSPGVEPSHEVASDALDYVDRSRRACPEEGSVFVADCGFDLADPQAGWRAYLAGHLPGARYLHLDRDLSGRPTGSNGRHPLPNPKALAETLRSAGLRKGQQVVAYDEAGGAFAARLWWLLRWIGHDAVAVLDGGKQAWIAAGQRLETGEAGPDVAGDFEGKLPDPAATVDADAVLANIGGQEKIVLDARTPERYRGEPNPLDPVAGHIPGAANRFFKDNLDVTGRFKPADALASEFRAVIGDARPDDVILQCGSGVTACHNALAMEIAGLPGARLYPGSWSEWIADPARPVERSA